MRLYSTVLLALLCVPSFLIARSQAAGPPGFVACAQPGVREPVWCGSVSVPENRSNHSGREIALAVVILPARGPVHAPDPVFWIEGGPGGSAIDDLTWWQDSPLRSQRDIVYVDLRGTKRSHPLNCDLYGRDRPGLQHYLGPEMFPAEDALRCARAFAGVVDLRTYTTSTMADDLDDVRAVLGYDRVNIVGLSAGTRTALVYLRRHPAHVRSLVLNGVDAPYHFAPSGFAKYAQHALEELARDCSTDLRCHQAFPDVLGDAKKTLADTRSGHAKANVPDPTTGEPVQVDLNAGILAEVIRNRLYTPGDASDLPVLLHAAAAGDYGPIAEVALGLRFNAASGMGLGVYLSSTCSEDMPGVDVHAEEQRAAGTFLGTSRLRQQAGACAAWPIGPVNADFSRRFSSDAPALIISGQMDPVTPASNGDDVARDLPNSLRVVVPHGGHCVGDGLVGFNCIDRLQAEFITHGSIQGLKVACVNHIHRREFSMTITPPTTGIADPKNVSQFVGRYRDAAGAAGAEVKLDGSLLRVEFDDGDTARLFPLSGLEFRVWGAPTRSARFEVRDGVVTGLSFERGGTRELELGRALKQGG